MKNSIFYIISLILLTISARSQAASNRAQAAGDPTGSISFENPNVDFGALKRGQKITAKFTFKNNGHGPLIIQGVQAPCDCTTVDVTKGKPIAPGEGGILEVTFDTTDYSGLVTKPITVVTNERAMPDRTLNISALVKSDLESDPPLVDFGEFTINQIPQQQVKIRNLMKGELKIERLRYNEDYLDVGYNRDGKDWVLHVKLKPNAPIGFLKDTIFVKNNSPSLPELPIPVRGMIKGQISSSPSYLEFGSIGSNDKSTRQITLTSLESFDITSNKVELMINGTKKDGAEKQIKISVTPIDKASKKVALDLINSGTGNGSVHGKILLETTNPQQKLITLDFYAFFR